ncbi:MAG TPA: 3-oxoacyl-ACP synthase, partial [Acidimicrobiaceae bacterium]|nr:3-oxoacyl-ACP synthase [Acidimicrobiaceae bacterium]
MTSTAISGARILSLGTALPEKVLTNEDLAEMVDTNGEWIVERTGIHERRVGGSTSDLAAEAGKIAIERAGIDPATIDLLILATTSPDRRVPASASTVQELLGLQCGAMDLNAACSGFVYSLVAAHGFIEMGHQRVLVIGAETLSRMTDYTDRTT